MTVLSGSDTRHQSYLDGLALKSDADIAAMNDEAVKQMLMDLRGMPPYLIITSNEAIARLPEDEAKVMLFDIRDQVRRS